MDGKKKPDDFYQHGHSDIESIKADLAKLYNLSDEEKSEQGLLQSRIEEQSNLIMMLKKRADEYLIRSQALERSNDELERKMKSLDDSAKREEKKYRVMQHNYNQLAASYEEIRGQFDGVRSINAQLELSKKALETEISELRLHVGQQDESEKIRDSLIHMESKNKELEKIIKTLNDKYTDKILHNEQELKIKDGIITSLNQTVEQMKMDLKNSKTVSLQSTEELRNENESLKKELGETNKNVEQLTIVVRKKNGEIGVLGKKVKDNENKYLQMKEKYEREAESINVNLQIKNLKSELTAEEKKRQELRQEYEAYKVHSNKMLQTEKELCARLRKLYS